MQYDIDFTDAQFESDEDVHPRYTAGFIKQKRDEIHHIKKFEQSKSKLPPNKKTLQNNNWHPLKVEQSHKTMRPQSAQQMYNTAPQLTKKVIPKQTKQYLTSQQSAKHTLDKKLISANKTVTFSNTYFPEKTPVIRNEYFDNSDAYQSDAPSRALKAPIGRSLHPVNAIKPEMQHLKELGVLDWEEDDDERFFIKNVSNVHVNTPDNPIEQQNRMMFLAKVKQPQQMTIQNQNEQLLKQQQQEIDKKKQHIQQLRLTEIIQNNLVISAVPGQQEEIVDDEYGDEQFEKEEEQQPTTQVVQVPIVVQQPQQPQQIINKAPKKQIYYPRNQESYKQELIQMQKELEQSLLKNNPITQQLYKEMLDTQDKEQTMRDISTERQDQLMNARNTLQQLKEKYDQQLHMIEELDKKERYALQIIEHLKINKVKSQQMYQAELKKYFAGKVILRYLRYWKDRRFYENYKAQKMLQLLKQ